MRRHAAIPWLTVLVAAGFAVTACGSDERAATVTTSTTTVATATSTTTVAATTATTTTTVAPTTTIVPTSEPVPAAAVFDFRSATAADGWRVVNDTVMGGVSNGDLTWSDGTMTFAGELSLANNGGFASVRSPEISVEASTDWAGRSGVRAELEGDGRTWTLELRTIGESGGWIASFPTPSEGSTTIEIPWTAFEPVTNFLEPRSAGAPLDPSRIVTVAFYLVDGIEGPFRLDLRSIG